MNNITLIAFQSHARAEFPRECCGVVVVVKGRERYVRCRNISSSAEQFIMHPEDYAAAEDLGEIIAICHSHPNLPPTPSEADLDGCERSGVEWHILNVHAEGAGEMRSFKPSGYVAPLYGLTWVHGIHDCYAMVRRYYQQELKIEIPDFPRDERWWDQGQNILMENFEQAGFVRVSADEIRAHDGLIMQIGAVHPNHCGVYAGNGIFAHHAMGRLSTTEVYGGYWHKITVAVVRHRSLL